MFTLIALATAPIWVPILLAAYFNYKSTKETKKMKEAEARTPNEQETWNVWNWTRSEIKAQHLRNEYDKLIHRMFPGILMWNTQEDVAINYNGLHMTRLYYGDGTTKYVPIVVHATDTVIEIATDNPENALIPKKPVQVTDEFIDQLIREAERNCAEGEFIFIPFSDNIHAEHSQRIINRYETLGMLEYVQGNKYANINNNPIYGDSYADEKGVYLAKFIKSDYYKCTHNLIEVYRKNVGDAKAAGIYAEFWIYKRIFTGMKGYRRVLWNVYLPNGNEPEAEVDVIVISESAIFCLECKNRRTPIHFENVEDELWSDGKLDKASSQFPNPIFQNKTHVRLLRDFLAGKIPEGLPIYNVVAFLKRGEVTIYPECYGGIDRYEAGNEFVLIGDDQDIKEKINKIIDSTEEKVLTKDQIDTLFDILYPRTQYTEKKKNEIAKKKQDAHSEETKES